MERSGRGEGGLKDGRGNSKALRDSKLEGGGRGRGEGKEEGGGRTTKRIVNGGRKKNSECKDLGACWNSSLYTEPSPLRHHIGTAVSSNQWSTGIWRSAMPLSPSLYQHEHSGGLSAHAGALDT